MKIKILLPIFLVIFFAPSPSIAQPVDECNCWKGFQPEKGANGFECTGIHVFHTMACNVPEQPRCQCTGNVTGILSDKTGIWCTSYAKGKETKRWNCENKEEWEEFYNKWPEYKS